MKKALVLYPGNKKVKNAVQDIMYGCWCRGRRIGGMQMPPLSHIYVATTLRESGIDTCFVDAATDDKAFDKLKKEIEDYALVAVLSSTNSFRNDVKEIEKLKELNPKLLSVFFGSHPTFMPEYCIKDPNVDIMVFREPEFIIRDLAKKIIAGEDWKNIKGIGYRDKSGNLKKNEPYPFVDMDELPMPDRKMLPEKIDYFNPVVKRMPYTTMQTSRGCPGKCSFCTVPQFFGKKLRVRSAENVMKEIRHIAELGYKEIFFRDETFTAFKKRNKEICENIISEKIDISWIANSRVDTVDAEQLTIMKKAGCHLIKLGVESGSDEILKNLKKGINTAQTREAFRLCREAGLDTHAHLMLGSPGETEESLKQTIEFIVSLNPTTASFGICTPFPGTELFEEVAEKHPEIKDGSGADMEKLHINEFFNDSFTSLPPGTLEKYLKKAYRKFYFRPAYILGRLKKIDSFSELMRLAVAGSNIFSFGLKGNN